MSSPLICCDCRKSVSANDVGVPPLYKGDRYVTCKSCRDDPRLEGFEVSPDVEGDLLAVMLAIPADD